MTNTETQSDALRLAALLQCGADDPMWDQHCEMLKQTVGDAAAELRRLHAENEALKVQLSGAKDTIRLNWLEQNDGRFYNYDRIFCTVKTGFMIGSIAAPARHDTLRGAIDAAITAQGQKKGGAE